MNLLTYLSNKFNSTFPPRAIEKLFGNVLSPTAAGDGIPTDLHTMLDLSTQPNYAAHAVDSSSIPSGRNNRNIKKFIKQNIFFIVGILFIVVIISLIISTLRSNADSSNFSNNTNPVQTTSNSKKTQQINKSLLFPLKDNAGKELSKIKYEIQTAELADTIVVKGQTAKASKGREFLIIALKITNDYDKTININSRDYIRLVVDGSTEKLAADIHNDPVEVQAISTKYTRLGFPIYTKDRNLELVIGEINGKKESIKLTLK
jgi:hypothetical protein